MGVLDGTVPMVALAVMEVMDTVDGLMVATAGEDMVDVGLNQLLSLPEQLTLESMLMVMESQTLLFLTEPDSDGPPEPSPELMLMEMEFPTMPLSTDQDMPPEDGELTVELGHMVDMVPDTLDTMVVSEDLLLPLDGTEESTLHLYLMFIEIIMIYYFLTKVNKNHDMT